MVDPLLPKTLSESILWTVAYTDQFQYPQTENEIWQRLLKISSVRKFTQQALKKELRTLVKHKKLFLREGFFFLPNQQKNVVLRLERAEISTQKWQQVTDFIQLVRWIPWIKSIWVTGSLAMMNAQEDQDVDFMIITGTQRLWMTRAIVTGVAFLVGKKRSPHGKENHTWCLNLWLDEAHLRMPIQKRNIYIAYEVIQAKKVFDRGESAQKFWKNNRWIKDFLPNGIVLANNFRTVLKHPSRLERALKKFSAATLSPLEKLAFHFQYSYMSRHKTTEQIGEGFAFFHPRQTAQIVSAQWQRRRKKLQ